MTSGVDLQRQYYRRTALAYDAMHMEAEHVHALHLLAAYIELYEIRSILDVGAGTGRAMTWLRRRFPDLTIKGVEPVEALRQQGHAKGIPADDLVDGDGSHLPFADNSFDLVCEFAVLHHVPRPELVVAEMSRVASRMVCISDSNFLGQGPGWLRALKLAIYLAGLWPLADWIKTRGKGYTYSEGDGIAYSYSVFQNVPQLRNGWSNVRLMTTRGDSDGSWGLRSTAAHMLVIAVDKRQQTVSRGK